MTTYKKIVQTQRPDGMPTPNDFELVETQLGELPPEHVTVEVDTLSIDAFIRTTLDQREDSFHGVGELGTPVVALVVGQVIDSTSDQYKVGDWVTGPLMAQTHAQLPAAALQKIEPAANIPPQTYLGVLGMTTGLTAWAGMVPVGGLKADQTVVVSAAGGAVGSVAAQLAKARGARVIGIAGGPEKCARLIDEYGLDATIDYKAGDVNGQLKALAPDGIDLFFDNVGGEILDAVLDNLAMGATVVICGAVSQYQNMTEVRGPALYLRIAERNACMRGFTVDQHTAEFEAGIKELSEYLIDGKIKLPEHTMTGIDSFPDALIGLLKGAHTGKMLVKPNAL